MEGVVDRAKHHKLESRQLRGRLFGKTGTQVVFEVDRLLVDWPTSCSIAQLPLSRKDVEHAAFERVLIDTQAEN